MTGSLIFLFGVYFVLFMSCAVGFVWWQRKKRGTRHPFPEEVSLLGGAGETQLKLIREIDESSFVWILVGSAVPAIVLLAMLWVGQVVPGILGWSFVVICSLFSLGLLLWEVRWFARKVIERGDRHLGYFGERYVAQCLEPLKRKGW